MSTRLELLLSIWIRHIYLRTLQNLQRCGSVLIISDKRPPAGFAGIANHSAYTNRAIQLPQQIQSQLRILQMFGFLISDEKLFMQKLYHFP